MTAPTILRRDDIDGLRAIAVAAVVVFHAFPSVLPGGFVGVDVFFVISGYLITGIIARGLRDGTFSFIDFYSRRTKRIFPALIVVLAACLLIGWTTLLHEEFRQLGRHSIAGALFVSNFVYWNEFGYFDMVAELKPLLHLWSLAVEEQFYLLWPVVLWTAWRLRISILALAIVVAVASFAANIWQVEQGALEAAFFSPGTRFWELMLGAALATSPRLGDMSARLRNCAAVSGLFAIAVAFAVVTGDAKFPGWWAVLPTTGTALLVIAGPAAWINRVVLARPMMMSIGLISYPLYLWHWPLLSLVRIVEGEVPPVEVRLAVIGVSVALAYVTFRLIERPIRFGSLLGAGLRPAAALIVLLAALAGAGYSVRKGVAQSITPHIAVNDGEIASERGHQIFFTRQREGRFLCTPERFQKWAVRDFAGPRCVQSLADDRKDVAIIGDSHAEDLFIGLAERQPDLNFVTYINSLPVRSNPAFGDVFDYVIGDRRIRAVVMTAYWNFHQARLPAGRTLQAELTTTVGDLLAAGKEVYLIDDRPVFPFDPSVCKYVRETSFWNARRRTLCEFDRGAFDRQRAHHMPALEAVARQYPALRLIKTDDLFCDADRCRMAVGGVLLYRDPHHLTLAGSRTVAERLAPFMTALPASARAERNDDRAP